MTYCLGIKTREGLVAIADTQISSGSNKSTKKKIYVEQHEKQVLFIMTSGLRSVRDKAVIYFQELFNKGVTEYDKMYKAVNEFGQQVKRVAAEDKEALNNAGLKFNLNTIIGGQLADDEEPKLFLIYSEGNWVEIHQDSPYVIIGNSGHGKTLLNRIINYDSSLKKSLKAGFLSFDATRISSNDVDFPIDVVIYGKDTYQMEEHRYTEKDLSFIADYWHNMLNQAVDGIPEEWIEDAFQHLNKNHEI